MGKTSKSLKGWGDTLKILGIILWVFGIIIWALDIASWPLITGLWMIVLSPVVHGFSVIVQNAEEQIEERHDIV